MFIAFLFYIFLQDCTGLYKKIGTKLGQILLVGREKYGKN